jgi:NAD(P)-dependent dehydrogenase (short-subunit alcohol dehydrogenase family)
MASEKYPGSKVAIVTGGGSGIGAATAQLLASAGYVAVVVDINEAGVQSVVRGIQDAGGRAEGHVADVASWVDASRVAQAVVSRHGGVDVLHNNAGITAIGNVETLEEAQWDAVINVNLKGIFQFSKACIPHMRARGGGAIVNTASANGLRPSANRDAYSAAKGGVIALTKGMAVSFAKDRIRVNCVCPGTVDTGLVRGVAQQLFPDFETAEKAFLARQPLGRIAQPMDIAKAVAFLASDDAAFVTGSAFVIDGGMILV